MTKGKHHWPGFRAQREGQLQQQPMAPKAQTQTQIQLEGKFYTGPIPEPEALQGYENISQGLAKRIVDMAETEQAHRHTIQRRRNWAQIWLSVAGQLFGFTVAMFTIGVAGFLLYHDKQLGGFTALIGGLGTLVGTFIYRRNRAAKGQQQ